MRIGIPREIKNNEYRVGLTADGAHALVAAGHQVLVESAAGMPSGITDQQYLDAGAQIVPEAEQVWAAEMVMKVKEPIASEYHHFREGLILFAYLHLAAEPELTQALQNAGVRAIGFETVREISPQGVPSLPLLAPMSEVAGRLSVQVGAQHLTAPAGGRGILLGGVPGVEPAHVVILGAGVAGTNALHMAIGLGARVSILDVSVPRLRQIDEQFQGRVATIASTLRPWSARFLAPIW